MYIVGSYRWSTGYIDDETYVITCKPMRRAVRLVMLDNGLAGLRPGKGLGRPPA